MCETQDDVDYSHLMWMRHVDETGSGLDKGGVRGRRQDSDSWAEEEEGCTRV
jgi:hypothetical protein